VTRWRDWARGELDGLRAQGRFRSVRTFDAHGPAGRLQGRDVVSFASNDYLGLTTHPAVVAAAHEALDRWGTGSGASRLIVGSRPGHDELEHDLADWKGAERALLLPTGFAANLAVLTVLAGPDVLVCSDELNHASIIDGCRLARAKVEVFPHRDLDHLAALLAAADRPAVVVSDTVFSMDGDLADVAGLAELCARHDALLVLDEAHAVLGPELPPEVGAEVVRVGTLSKMLGALGGFVVGAAPIIDLLVNRARPFIFTTAPTPADTAAARAALAVLRSPEGDALRARLRHAVERVRPGHPSPIVPVVLGHEDVALAASARLLEQGILVPAIRPPTVPPGTSRLRVALSAAHTDEMLDALLGALAGLGVLSGGGRSPS